MLASLIETGFFMWAFYASQPYLLDLLDSDAVWIAGAITAGIALSTILGNEVVEVAARFCGRRTTLLLVAGAIQTIAAVVLGLTESFWVALPALFVLTAGLGVIGPVRQAYLHQLIPSEQRATVISFDSMVSGVGGVSGQVGLGALGEARSIGTAFVVGGLATAAALPLFGAVRRIGGPADRFAGESAGAECGSAAKGLPAVTLVGAIAVEDLEPSAAAEHV